MEKDFDEVDCYFTVQYKLDKSCLNLIDWWAKTGRKTYPYIAALACISLMTMGSSVPLAAAFLQAGGIVTASYSRMLDNNLEILRACPAVVEYCVCTNLQLV